MLTDADVVVPVGRFGYDPDLGYRGPWSVVFPGLSDRETMRALRNRGGSRRPERSRAGRIGPRMDESFEVSWLLGTQFHIGLVPGADGLLEVVAGRDTAVRDQGIAVAGATLDVPGARPGRAGGRGRRPAGRAGHAGGPGRRVG